MAHFLKDVSHTFGEYLLIPGLTTEESTPDRIQLYTPLARYSPKVEEVSHNPQYPFCIGHYAVGQ